MSRERLAHLRTEVAEGRWGENSSVAILVRHIDACEAALGEAAPAIDGAVRLLSKGQMIDVAIADLRVAAARARAALAAVPSC